MSAKVRKVLNLLKREFQRLYGDSLAAMILYGSHARGDARPDSDVDVLLVIRGDFDYIKLLKQSDNLAASLSLDNDIVISRAFVSEKDYAERQSPFMLNVHREGIAV